MPVSAVVFDFVGTLVEVKGYDYDSSVCTLHDSLVQAGFNADRKCFIDAYKEAHERWRGIRYQRLVEVTNAVWITDALSMLGYKVSPKDGHVRAAVNIFFKQYLDSIQPRPGAGKVLSLLSKEYRLGLVSNFTYAPVIYAALRKVGFNGFFNTVLVSQEFGWRKPSYNVFSEVLRRLNACAHDTVFVGDSPVEDIGGALWAGLRTVFIPSQFYAMDALRAAQVKPDAVIKTLDELPLILQRLDRNSRGSPEKACYEK